MCYNNSKLAKAKKRCVCMSEGDPDNKKQGKHQAIIVNEMACF